MGSGWTTLLNLSIRNKKTSYAYDSGSDMLVREEHDPGNVSLGYAKTYVHDNFGNILESTTIPQDTSQPENKVKTEYGYNEFGEMLVHKTAIGYEKSSLNWIEGHSDTTSNAIFYKSSEVKGIAPVLEFYDILGCVVRTVTVGFNSQKIYSDVVYNAKGQIGKTSEPYFAGQMVYWNRNKYDAVGRVTQHIYADNSVYTFQYNGFETTTTDPLGNKTIKKVDVNGNLSEHFDYDELKRLVKVSHNGVLKQEMRYDAAGNLTYKTGVGSLFTYQIGTNRLVSIAGGGYSPKNWDEIRYTVNNKISYIRTGNDSQTIHYGPAKERKKTVTVVDGVTETKYYCGGLYEEVIKSGEIKKICYIFVDGESIAIFEQSSINGDKLLYLHKDHLGSIQANQ